MLSNHFNGPFGVYVFYTRDRHKDRRCDVCLAGRLKINDKCFDMNFEWRSTITDNSHNRELIFAHGRKDDYQIVVETKQRGLGLNTRRI